MSTPWEIRHGLSTRLKRLPLVLCGPMLRRVEPTSVSVFVALKRRCSITLSIYKGLKRDAAALLIESPVVESTALGKYLHVAVVTVHLPPARVLEPGTLYGYDLTFIPLDPPEPGDAVSSNVGEKATLQDLSLVTATAGGLGYGANRLPSFSLPPSDLAQLRIVHGSCRKPHGEGLDALVALDDMIGKSLDQPNARPHQLFLTGDQIYADDVADALLLALTDAGNVLLSWPLPELLPGIPNQRAPELNPGRRAKLAKELAGISAGGVSKSHLFRLGEYYAMYPSPGLPNSGRIRTATRCRSSRTFIPRRNEGAQDWTQPTVQRS